MGPVGTGITGGEKVGMTAIQHWERSQRLNRAGIGTETTSGTGGVGGGVGVAPEIETGVIEIDGTERETGIGKEIETTGIRKLRRRKDLAVGAGLAPRVIRRVKRRRSPARKREGRRGGRTAVLMERGENLRRTKRNLTLPPR